MKSLSCRELGKADCDFVAVGDTHDEIIRQMFQHAQASHKKMLDSMSEQQKTRIVQMMHHLLSKQNSNGYNSK